MNKEERIEAGFFMHKRYNYNESNFEKKLKYMERDLRTLVKIGFTPSEIILINIEKTLTTEIWIGG